MRRGLAGAASLAAATLAFVPAGNAGGPINSPPTLFQFGRGVNGSSYSVAIFVNGSVAAKGLRPLHHQLSADTVAQLTALRTAVGFDRLPAKISCPGSTAATAHRFIRSTDNGELKTVTVRGGCSKRFNRLYSALLGAVGVA